MDTGVGVGVPPPGSQPMVKKRDKAAVLRSNLFVIYSSESKDIVDLGK